MHITFQNEYRNRTLHKEFAIARAIDNKSCPNCEMKRIERNMSTKEHSMHHDHKKNHELSNSDSDDYWTRNCNRLWFYLAFYYRQYCHNIVRDSILYFCYKSTDKANKVSWSNEKRNNDGEWKKLCSLLNMNITY